MSGTETLSNPRLWPITIILTRYGGTYEGGPWAAFNLDNQYIPEAAMGDDISCATWWDNFGGGVGVGRTPDDALQHLLSLERQLKWEDICDF